MIELITQAARLPLDEQEYTMTTQPTIDPQPGDLRVWHIPQIPGEPFYVLVSALDQAKHILALLSAYDEFLYDENIRGDFSSAQGLERYEESGGNPGDPPYDWFEVDLEFEFFDELAGEVSS